MSEPTLSARQTHSERIRNALLQSCADLLYEKPIDAITINEIVERAGVAKGSFYNHFADKEALQVTVSTEILEQVERQVRGNNASIEDPAYRLTRGLCTHICLAVSEPRLATIMLRGHDWALSGQHELYKNVRDDIAQGVAVGRFAERCKDVGALQVIGTGYFIMLRILERHLGVRRAIDVTVRALTLILCGFGLEETEARHIAMVSAEEIIKR